MNTPAHAVVNLVLLGRRDRPELVPPILLGSVLPDLPMFVFYLVERVGMGRPEQVIWSQSYFAPHWQDLFDVFNSFPLIGLMMAMAYLAGNRWMLLLGVSMALHGLFDLPLHYDDGHRHFFPFSEWRFASPVSYWDPAHHGRITGPIEALFVLTGSVILWIRYESRRLRAGLLAVGVLYVAYLVFALIMWVE
jgi:hypothetical protein